MNLKPSTACCLAVAAALLLIALVPVPATAAGPGRAAVKAAAATAPIAQPRTVTLITGDRVVLPRGDTTRLVVQPAKGRERMSFLSQRSGKQLTVVPADAVALVQAGKLDRRLFDVTALLAFGYDDRRTDLPLIVTYAAGARTKSGDTWSRARTTRALPTVNGQALRVAHSQGAAFWNELSATATVAGGGQRALGGGVAKVWLDGLRKPTLDESVPQIGAPAAWQAGFDGAGVKVAVLDTGIDATHPDLAAQVIAAKNFSDDPDARDRVGHGTHVASTIAGTGAASGGRYKGVAPGAKLLDGKVCESDFCTESAMLAGLEWGAQNAPVVSMSIGGFDTPDIDPLEQAVNTLTAKYGTLFVIAAGNDGAPESVGSPASADAALAVGAVDKKDKIADFSSRGPRVGDGAIKPDITGPGVAITAARSKDGVLGNPGDKYTELSGTSMATPHVSGSAAILAGQHPTWKADQLKSALMGSAKVNPGLSPFDQGSGRVDVARGTQQKLTAAPAGLNFGGQLWPHRDDTPVNRKLTYHNDGAAPLTLTLAVQVTTSARSAAAVFKASPATLTIPAHGDASTTVTADTSVPGPDTPVAAYLTATGGNQVVRTSLVVNKEVESYNLTLKHLDRAGKPTDQYGTGLVELDTGKTIGTPQSASGVVTMRVPKGRYTLASVIFAGTFVNGTQSALIDPSFDFGRNQTLVLDARAAKAIAITVPRSKSRPFWTVTDFYYGSSAVTLFSFFAEDRLFTGQIGDQKPAKGALSTVTSFWADPTPDFSNIDSPVTYSLLWYERDRAMTGLRKNVALRELATVHADLAHDADGPVGVKGAFGHAPGANGAGSGGGVPYHLPFRATDYFNNQGGVGWEVSFSEGPQATDEDPFPAQVSWTDGRLPTYQAGRIYHETWNQGVFGPSFATFGRSSFPGAPLPAAAQFRDEIFTQVPVYGDSGGHNFGSDIKKGSVTLFRNGTKVGASTDPFSGFFEVPSASARYRLEVLAKRGAPLTLSTNTETVWSFTSSHPGDDSVVVLPLSVVRFGPALDLNNTAPAGKAFTMPVAVVRQPKSQAALNKKLMVDVSYDDGKTWQSAKLTKTAYGRWTAALQHPNRTGFVSLRASATDTAGNTVQQTIIRAYRIAPPS